MMTDPVERAFKAGWKANAVVTPEWTEEVLAGVAHVDWLAYQAGMGASDSVKVPESVEEAGAMILIAESYLKANKS